MGLVIEPGSYAVALPQEQVRRTSDWDILKFCRVTHRGAPTPDDALRQCYAMVGWELPRRAMAWRAMPLTRDFLTQDAGSRVGEPGSIRLLRPRAAGLATITTTMSQKLGGSLGLHWRAADIVVHDHQTH